MNKEIELGDVFLIYTLEELKEKYSDLIEHDISVELPNQIPHSRGVSSIHLSKQYLGKQLIVFSMDYRDYPEPCLCLTTNTEYKEYFCKRMSGHQAMKEWLHIEDNRELIPFIKESKNIFDI